MSLRQKARFFTICCVLLGNATLHKNSKADNFNVYLVFMKNELDNKSEKYGLPHNRWQVFGDRIKTHFGKFLLCGLILLIFALPLFAVRMYADMSVATLYDKYKQELLTADEYSSAVATVTLVASALNVVGFLVFAVGLSGVVRQVRQMAWSEPVEFWKDFAVGVKQNVGRYLIVFFVLGVLNAFDSVVMQTNSDVWSYIPLCLYVFVVFPLALHMLVQVAIYNHKFGDIFATSAFLYVKTLPISILFSVLFMSHGLLDMVSVFAVRYVCKMVFVLALPIAVLAWFLYVCSALDKYVNKQSYPQLVDKGVWRL